jgi:hypothetical protein
VVHRSQAWIAIVIVTALVLALVVLELSERAVRRFWSNHPLTADTVAGVLVVGLTVVIVDQIIRRRQIHDQSRAIGAHAAIMLIQARRAVDAALAVRDRDGDRGAAGDAVRTYLLMLLVGAPVLLEEPMARRFLEQAQVLAAELGRILSPADVGILPSSAFAGGLDEAIRQLRGAAVPLLAALSADERSAVTDGISAQDA